MKTKIIFLCAVFLTTQAITYGQKTKVSVQKGKVIAQTTGGTVTVDAGQKAVLTPDKEPLVTVDNPMVDDLVKIYKWVEQEKQAQRKKIDSTNILIVRVENEHLFTLAALQERPNSKSEPSNICQISSSGVLDELKVYDLQGNLLPFDFEQRNALTSDYFVHFTRPVEPSEKFKYIAVGKYDYGSMLRNDGTLWHLEGGGSAENCLNYYRLILPESAIFVDSSQPVTTIESFDGRLSVTCRVYAEPIVGRRFYVAFLWPDKDGTTLAELPPQYRGFRNQREEEIIEEGRLEIGKILAGNAYDDQSTPLKTLLAFYSAIIHKDKESFLGLMGNPIIREIAAKQYKQVVGQYGRSAIDFDFLGTPNWPEKPENGFTHPVYLCRKGSLLCAATITMVYQSGKWYWQDMEFGGKKTYK